MDVVFNVIARIGPYNSENAGHTKAKKVTLKDMSL